MTQTRRASTVSTADFMRLAQEYRVLLAAHGVAQRRCSRLISAQQMRIEALEAQAMRLHAAAILRDSALAFAHDDRAALKASIPGLHARATLARCVDARLEHTQSQHSHARFTIARLATTDIIPP